MGRRMAVVIVAGVVLAACSNSGGSDSPPNSTPDSPSGPTPVLDRIDGPAQVDPSFDPMQVDPTTPGTESGG